MRITGPIPEIGQIWTNNVLGLYATIKDVTPRGYVVVRISYDGHPRLRVLEMQHFVAKWTPPNSKGA